MYQPGTNPSRSPHLGTPPLQLDDMPYHRIKTADTPPGRASLPLKLNREGNIYLANAVAGVVGMRAWSSRKDLHERPGEKGLDTLSVEAGWWLYEKKSDEQMKSGTGGWASSLHGEDSFCLSRQR
jgi:Domain of unknown function (DUF4419)